MKIITKWLTDNWYNLLKVVAVILVGGLIYEAVSTNILNNRANTLIKSMESDYTNISNRLVESEDRVVDLKATVSQLRLGSAELGRELAISDRIRGDLWNENQRLGGFLSQGKDSAKKLGGIHQELGESIDRAWEIIERYEVGTGRESGKP